MVRCGWSKPSPHFGSIPAILLAEPCQNSQESRVWANSPPRNEQLAQLRLPLLRSGWVNFRRFLFCCLLASTSTLHHFSHHLAHSEIKIDKFDRIALFQNTMVSTAL